MTAAWPAAADVAVVTTAAGRRRHLERQVAAVRRTGPAPARHVIVALDTNAPTGLEGMAARETDRRGPSLTVVHRPAAAGAPLPVGAARNAGIAAAAAPLVVWQDVDCLPAGDLLAPVLHAARRTRGAHLLTWPVGRLGPLHDRRDRPAPGELARARAAAGRQGRPVLAHGHLEPASRPETFWSLAFAVTPETHARIGGFDEAYVGYGAEDTDYALRAQAAGVPITWVGGAWSYHQHHPVSRPPAEHLDDIVRNARRFRAVWGRWPMEGWLRDFARQGLIEWTPDGDVLQRVSAGAR